MGQNAVGHRRKSNAGEKKKSTGQQKVC